MGTTQWNNKENMTNMVNLDKALNRLKETFDNKKGFTKIPTLSNVRESLTPSYSAPEEVEEPEVVKEPFDNKEGTSIDGADIDIEKALVEYNLGEIFNLEWFELPDNIKNSDSGCENMTGSGEDDEGEGEGEGTIDKSDAKETLSTGFKYTRLYIRNITKIIITLPKLILFILTDGVKYLTYKTAIGYSKMFGCYEASDHKVVYEQFNKILYTCLVFFISYNWFFTLFYFTENNGKYKYESNPDNDYYIHDLIRMWQKLWEPQTWGYFLANSLFLPGLVVITFITYILQSHSYETIFTLPNILQSILTLHGKLDWFNSFPVKFIVTLVLVYYGIDPVLKILKNLVGIKTSDMGDNTIILGKIFYALLSFIGFYGFTILYLGPNAIISIFKNILDPLNTEDSEGNQSKKPNDPTDVGDAIREVRDSMDGNYYLLYYFTLFLQTILTFILRIGSYLSFIPYTNLAIFLIIIGISFLSAFNFSSFENIKDIILRFNTLPIIKEIIGKTNICFTMKDHLSNRAAFFNKHFFSILILLIIFESFGVFNEKITCQYLNTWHKIIGGTVFTIIVGRKINEIFFKNDDHEEQ